MLRNIYISLVVTVLSCATATMALGQAADTTKPAAASATTGSATPPPPALSITGSADFYYRYDFNKTNANLTSFTSSHDQFKLGMATVKLEHKTAKLDMVADLGFGPRAQEFAYNDEGIVQAIKQLYISYSPAAWIKFTGGTWATHIGYEVVDAYANRNYSMSYMFTNGPFSHTGVRADFAVGKSGFMIGVSNPTDFRSIPAGGQNNKNMIAQYSYAPSDNFKLYLNYVGGRDIADNRVHQYDLVLTAKASSIFSVGANATVNKSSLMIEDYASSRTWYFAPNISMTRMESSCRRRQMCSPPPFPPISKWMVSFLSRNSEWTMPAKPFSRRKTAHPRRQTEVFCWPRSTHSEQNIFI